MLASLREGNFRHRNDHTRVVGSPAGACADSVNDRRNCRKPVTPGANCGRSRRRVEHRLPAWWSCPDALSSSVSGAVEIERLLSLMGGRFGALLKAAPAVGV